jgi:hypothetical protein
VIYSIPWLEKDGDYAHQAPYGDADGEAYLRAWVTHTSAFISAHVHADQARLEGANASADQA